MKNKRNYYRLLQVQPDAADAVIRASYRAMMQKLRMHPDLGGSASEAALLNQAYQTLSDPARRAVYDQLVTAHLLRQRSQPGQTQKTAATQPCPFCQHPQATTNRVCSRCQSTLRTVSLQAINNADKRTIHRVNQRARVSFLSQWPQQTPHRGRIENLSPHGMQLQCRFRLAPGQCIRLFNDSLQAVGRVIRCEQASAEGSFSAGIEFLTLHFERRTGAFLSTRC